jgi:hypothetical protein
MTDAYAAVRRIGKLLTGREDDAAARLPQGAAGVGAYRVSCRPRLPAIHAAHVRRVASNANEDTYQRPHGALDLARVHGHVATGVVFHSDRGVNTRRPSSPPPVTTSTSNRAWAAPGCAGQRRRRVVLRHAEERDVPPLPIHHPHGHGSPSPSTLRCSTTAGACTAHWATAHRPKPLPTTRSQPRPDR